ncbi:MAG: ABC transporter ATP-binding protein [Planctomycetales bacterium]|nr:ABC transporter ATP-binding protein [Planctomycetales bacterium]
MNSFQRILPYLWPSRHKLFLSFFFAGLVALFWGANLSIVFPAVKVLIEDESISGYVHNQIQNLETEEQHYGEQLVKMDDELRTAREKDKSHLLARKSRLEAKLSATTLSLGRFRWIQYRVVPLVPEDKFNTLAVLLGLLLMATVVKAACMLAEETLVGSVVQLTVMGVRKACFRRVLQLDYQTLSRQGTPELMSRFTFDMETLASGLSLLGGKIVREPLKAAACVGFAFWVNWRLTLLSLLFVPLALFIFHRIGRTLKKASHRSMESMSRIYKVLEETFDSLKVVIAFNGGQRHRRQHHHENKTYFQKSMKIVLLDAITSPTTELLGMCAVFIAVLPGAYLVLRQTTTIWEIKLAASEMDIAELSVLYALLAGVTDPVRKLSSVFSKLKRATATADRIFELMDRESKVAEPTEPKALPAKISQIEFRGVGFTYLADGHARPAALDSVNLKATTGDVIAVVGENGSGKSTLLNLLPRYFDPDRGGLFLDGVDVRDCRLDELRSRIAVVPQETLLFDDTILENIRYGHPTATRHHVEQAAERAHVSQFLPQLPEGLDTRVGERGSRLSGGQRQRIAFARAMLRDPGVLILDEATSAIDAQSEQLIFESLESFVSNRITFLITHSMTQGLLKLVTRVAVMDQGRLIALGPHAELLQSCPTYRRLYQVQVEQTTTEFENRIVHDDGGPSESDEIDGDADVIPFTALRDVRQRGVSGKSHLRPTGTAPGMKPDNS